MSHRITKTLSPGMHIVSFPLAIKLSELLPRVISGSTIELMSDDGNWINKEQIIFLNNDFKLSEHYSKLVPF
ncbi:MAG: hypothetical protein HRU22_03505 [Gammaproteobacteria bacterium]|nr:hypothetical protein [Gammaproteobacteria bacterium]